MNHNAAQLAAAETLWESINIPSRRRILRSFMNASGVASYAVVPFKQHFHRELIVDWMIRNGHIPA